MQTTNREQEQRLIEAGVKPESADLYRYCGTLYISKCPQHDAVEPVWSMSRLWEIASTSRNFKGISEEPGLSFPISRLVAFIVLELLSEVPYPFSDKFINRKTYDHGAE